MTSRLSESDSASPRHTAEITSATRSPQLREIERPPVLVEHAEVVQVDVPVAVQTGRHLLDDCEPEVLEDGQEVRQPDLPRRLVEPDAGQVLLLAALVLQTDGKRLSGIELLELLDVERARGRRRSRPCSSRGSRARTCRPARCPAPPRGAATSLSRSRSSHVRATDTTSCSSSANETSGIGPSTWTVKCIRACCSSPSERW